MGSYPTILVTKSEYKFHKELVSIQEDEIKVEEQICSSRGRNISFNIGNLMNMNEDLLFWSNFTWCLIEPF